MNQNPFIYFDNAATTLLDKTVLEAMLPFMTAEYGNPSSLYSFGRNARIAIETARKSVAVHLHVDPAEILFTSGGTESNNTAITCAVRDLGCRHIITSAIEHHAVLNPVECSGVTYSLVKLNKDGHINLKDLERELSTLPPPCLVSLMHGNNEIGNMMDLEAVGMLCEKHQAIFHSDGVQTLGHYPLDLRKAKLHFFSGSAHKFHGPKGTGILYVHKGLAIKPFISGGAQERNRRAGTENVSGIVGLSSALDLAMKNYCNDGSRMHGLKYYLMDQLRRHIRGITFNGDPEGRSLYAVLSVVFPETPKVEMLLHNLDIHHIAASGGSACNSGSGGSHVIRSVNYGAISRTVRFSFSKNNSREEIDQLIDTLKKII